MKFSSGADYLSVNEAAVALKCSRSQIYALYKAGQLAMIRHNGRLWLEPAELEDYFARLRSEARKERVSKHREAKRSATSAKSRTKPPAGGASLATTAA